MGSCAGISHTLAPTGEIQVEAPDGTIYHGTVTCIEVEDNLAVLAGTLDQGPNDYFVLWVMDTPTAEKGSDMVEFFATNNISRADCDIEEPEWILLGAYRRGERWAWWLMWLLPAWSLSVTAMYLVFGLVPGTPPPPPLISGSILGSISTLVLLADRRRFATVDPGRSLVDPDAHRSSSATKPGGKLYPPLCPTSSARGPTSVGSSGASQRHGEGGGEPLLEPLST